MTSRPTTTEDWRVRVCRAMDYLSDHLAAPLDIAGAAQAARCSPYHFHRLFTALVGETVGAFVRRLRLERPERLPLPRSHSRPPRAPRP